MSGATDTCSQKLWRDCDKKEVMTESSSGGKKGVKIEAFDLIPIGPLTELSRVYGRGAEKYARRNWEKGYEFSKSYAALMRHLTQFWNGEDFDQETKVRHLASVAFHAFALLQYSMNDKYKEFDDRPESTKL